MKSVEKKHRRFLAAILTLCLLLGLCPLTPSAQAEETTATAASSTTIEGAQSVPIGESVTSTLNDGDNYYAIPDVKAGQQISVELDKAGSGTSLRFYRPDGRYWGDSGNGYQLDKMADADGKYYFSVRVSQPTTVTFTVTLYDNDAHEPNDTLETATPIEPGKTVDGVLFSEDEDYFAITTTKPYQYIVVDKQTADTGVNVWGRDAAGKGLEGVGNSTRDVFCTAEAGTYYLHFSTGRVRASYSFPVTLYDNDTNEPNDTKAAATTLHSGESAEFTLAGRDVDYFKVTTTAPGQDIALTVSGYNYANWGEKFSLYFDPAGDLQYRNPSCAAYAEIDANRTLYLHAAAAGEHYIALNHNDRYGNIVFDPLCLTRTLSVEILDGDQNEPNDTRETATRLTLGTDETFMVGGFGDEDWFSFEAVPDGEGKALYTLSFLDLNTDYSDEFFYEVYAPDGTLAVERTRVNIRHVNTIGCDQEGQYLVRVCTTAAKGTYYFAKVDGYYDGYYTSKAMDYKRSALRICVSEGGDDPYESNDTWLTAANVPVGNIQHVLASTADEDWFCFTVPEDDMTLHLTSAKKTRAALYRAEDLLERGDDANCLFADNIDKIEYYKLSDAGVYYLKLRADSSYTSTDIRTTSIELLPATDEENNDTWKKATPLYEGVRQSFGISAKNDVDWFKLVVPKGGAKVKIQTNSYLEYSLYCEQDFLTVGDNAAAMRGWKSTDSTVADLDAGTYYLKATSISRWTNCFVIYNILPVNTNSSLETAKPLAPGEWAELCDGGVHYFSIGVCREGDVVRISYDAAGGRAYNYNKAKLLNASGKEVGAVSYYDDYRANRTIKIPEGGRYYLCADAYWTLDDNGEPKANRLRYDIGSEDGKDPYVYSEEYIGMLEGETMFLDLYCRPENAKTNGGNSYYMTYDVAAPDCVSYDAATGYLSAKSAGTGVLKVSLKGEPDTAAMEIRITVLAKDSLKAQRVFVYAPDTMALGTSVDIEADYGLEDNVWLTNPKKAITWTSSDPKVLYVSPGGKITAVGGGTATVTASVGGVSEESAPITVTAAAETPQETVSSIKLNKYSLTLYVGEAGEQLTASILPEGSTARVTWASSNTKAAAVSPDGVVTPIAPGMSTITAEAGGRHVSATVSVLAERVRVSGVSFDETEHKIPVRGTAKLTATIAPADATVKTLVWTSDDPGIASVSRTGIVTAVSVGTTKIHATSVDGNHSAEVTVTVTAAPQLGDVNGDGYIDSADAMLCLRSAVGLTELTAEQKSAADVNKDGFVDAGDAIKILRYDAKLIDSLK